VHDTDRNGASRGPDLEELFILVIEDDPIVQALIDEALGDGGSEPAVAASGEQAVTRAAKSITGCW
jgi:CheY-like chemotaxis protein